MPDKIFALSKYAGWGVAIAALGVMAYMANLNAGEAKADIGGVISAITNHDTNNRADNRELITAIKENTKTMSDLQIEMAKWQAQLKNTIR